MRNTKKTIDNIGDLEGEIVKIEIVVDGAIEELAGFKGKKFKVCRIITELK